MMRGHDLYESLAGAVALGEATDAERDAFAAHAAGCDRCRGDLDALPERMVSSLRALPGAETWRPVVRDGVRAKISASRNSRFRTFGTALAMAVGFTIALDLGFSSGSLGQLFVRFEPQQPAPTPIAFVPKIPAAASQTDVPAAAPVALAIVPHHHHTTVRKPVAKPVTPEPGDDALPSLDVFSGLAIDPAAEARAPHVARADRDGETAP